MRREDLETIIRSYLMTTYKAEYIGKMSIIQNEELFIFNIGIPDELTPITISYEGSEEKFISYLKEELRKKNFMRQSYYKVNKINENSN